MLKILHLDDDIVDQKIIAEYLEDFAEIESYLYCEEATEALKNNEYDCLLIDYFLPDGDGVSFVKEARKDGYKNPVLILTGVGDEMLARRVMKDGEEYLPKNEITQNPKLLRSTILDLIQEFNLKQENNKIFDDLNQKIQAKLHEKI